MPHWDEKKAKLTALLLACTAGAYAISSLVHGGSDCAPTLPPLAIESIIAKFVHASSLGALGKQACPCCGWQGDSFGPHHARKGVRCRQCRSLERHRRACAALGAGTRRAPEAQKGLPFFKRSPQRESSGIPFRLAHFGPQRQMEKILNEGLAGVDQISLDFLVDEYKETYSRNVLHADVTQIPLPSDFADGVIIMHVLEHVPDVKRALAELKRVTRSDGWLLIEVPCFDRQGEGHKDCRGQMSNEERKAACGQWDHVWKYDCKEWAKDLAAAGLQCYTVDGSDHNRYDFGDATPIVDRFLFPRNIPLYMCHL